MHVGFGEIQFFSFDKFDLDKAALFFILVSLFKLFKTHKYLYFFWPGNNFYRIPLFRRHAAETGDTDSLA